MTDWSPLIQAAGVVVTTVLVPWAIVEYRKRTGVELTDQQRAAVQAALTTAAGTIETLIDQKKISVDDVKPDHPAIIAEVQKAIARVPDSAAAQGLTTKAAAEIVVGRVDTSAPGPDAPVVVNVPPPPEPTTAVLRNRR